LLLSEAVTWVRGKEDRTEKRKHNWKVAAKLAVKFD